MRILVSVIVFCIFAVYYFVSNSLVHVCGKPPRIKHSVVTYVPTYLGATAHYACAKNFRTCNTMKTWALSCGSSGQWTGEHGDCQQYTWPGQKIAKNETYWLDIPCEPSDTVIVSLAGYLRPKERFQVMFRHRNDLILYMTTRRKILFSVVILNSRTNGKWGEEVSRIFMFPENKLFAMMVEFRQGIYKVIVDGEHVGKFRDRHVGVKPEIFSIRGNIKLKYLSINQ